MKSCRLAMLVFSLLLYVLFVVLALAGPSPIAPAPDNPDVSFRWVFGAQVGADNGTKLVAITQDTTLQTGDQLKMALELQKPCFVYVIHHGAQGEIHWLFPASRQRFDAEYGPGQRYDIPEGEAWFRLNDHVGRETFYLLASVQRLHELEELLDSYGKSPAAEQAPLASRIVMEIRALRKRHAQFTTLAERPIPIAGNMRTPTGELLGNLAVEITAQHFYGKTYTIEHR